MIKFHCPNCDAKISAGPEHGGCVLTCPSCQGDIVVPHHPRESNPAPIFAAGGPVSNELRALGFRPSKNRKKLKKVLVEFGGVMVGLAILACTLLFILQKRGDSRTSAHAQSPESLHKAAWSCIEAKDFPTASARLKTAADLGYAPAQRDLGLMYYAGVGVQENHSAALSWNLKAAEQGDKWAQARLATQYLDAIDVEFNPEKGIELLRKAADRGDAIVQGDLGALLFLKAKDIPSAREEAEEWMKLAAEGGCPASQAMLGMGYLSGVGFLRDRINGYMWMVICKCASKLEVWRNSDHKRREMISPIYKSEPEFAFDENVQSVFNKLTSEMTTEELSQADKLARMWCKRHNVNDSIIPKPENIATRRKYELNMGIQDPGPANLTALKVSANLGRAVDQAYLGACYLYGLSTEINYLEAARWIRASAEQGHPLGEGLLGICYLNGYYVDKDANAAKQWLRKSADHGSGAAQEVLNSLGVTP